MVRIERHAVDVDIVNGTLKSASALVPKVLHAIRASETSSLHLPKLQGWSLTSTSGHILQGVDMGAIYESLMIAYEAHKAMFIVAHDDSDAFRVRIGRGPSVILRGVTPRMLRAPAWAAAYWIARIFRDEDGLEWLSDVPVGVLRRYTKTNEDVFPWVEALGHLHRGDGDAVSVVRRTISLAEQIRDGKQKPVRGLEGTSEPEETRLARDIGLRRFLPSYICLLRVLEEDEAGFNQSMEAALILHRDFWSEPDRKNEPMGFVSYALTGIAALAYDRGMRLTVESDYLPGYLVEPVLPYPPR